MTQAKPTGDRARRVAAAVAAGLLLAAAFPRTNQSWLAWVGLVPLLLALRGRSPRSAAALGWLAGFVFYLVSVSWIPDTISNFTSVPPAAAFMLLVLMAAVAAYGQAVFAGVLEWAASHGVPRLWMAPPLWAVLEWTRGFVVAEFPWNLLGYSQMRYLDLAQAADLGGVYLLSAVLVLANVALAESVAAHRAGGEQAGRKAARLLVAAALAPALLGVYGHLRLAAIARIPYTGSIRVGIVQGNVAQDQKWDAAVASRIFERYLRLSDQAVEAGAELVVWPEASLPFSLRHDLRSTRLLELAEQRNVDLLVGAPGFEERDGDGGKPYNQAWLLRSGGDVQGPYDKIQLVPFGEYIPLHGLFGLVDVAVESVGQLGRGTDHTIFETRPLDPPTEGAAPPGRSARFAVLICYEGIFPSLVQSFAAKDPDFLVNISNDAWYGDTAAPDQHLEMASMRAIENRLPLVRSTNTGISAFVTDEGRIGPTTPLFHEDMVVEKVLTRSVWSAYRAWGDVFLHGCQAATVLLLALAARGRARRHRAPVGPAAH